jgi:O-antigen ligase
MRLKLELLLCVVRARWILQLIAVRLRRIRMLSRKIMLLLDVLHLIIALLWWVRRLVRLDGVYLGRIVLLLLLKRRLLILVATVGRRDRVALRKSHRTAALLLRVSTAEGLLKRLLSVRVSVLLVIPLLVNLLDDVTVLAVRVEERMLNLPTWLINARVVSRGVLSVACGDGYSKIECAYSFRRTRLVCE